MKPKVEKYIPPHKRGAESLVQVSRKMNPTPYDGYEKYRRRAQKIQRLNEERRRKAKPKQIRKPRPIRLSKKEKWIRAAQQVIIQKEIERTTPPPNYKIPPKRGDPGSFSLTCTINSIKFYNCLVDSGASINMMPLHIYLQLGLGPLKSTNMILKMANHTLTPAGGIVENVLVQIEKFSFYLDFVVLDIEEDLERPLILGRSFLATSRAILDMDEGMITLRVGDDKIEVDMMWLICADILNYMNNLEVLDEKLGNIGEIKALSFDKVAASSKEKKAKKEHITTLAETKEEKACQAEILERKGDKENMIFKELPMYGRRVMIDLKQGVINIDINDPRFEDAPCDKKVVMVPKNSPKPSSIKLVPSSKYEEENTSKEPRTVQLIMGHKKRKKKKKKKQEQPLAEGEDKGEGKIINIAMKHGDPGSISLNCSIKHFPIDNCLIDTGASVNLMPIHFYDLLGFGPLREIDSTVKLADNSCVDPLGLLENAFVQVGDIFVCVDFVVMDVDVDISSPIILGRPFMVSSNAIINMRDGTISLQVGDASISFAMEWTHGTREEYYVGYIDVGHNFIGQDRAALEKTKLESFARGSNQLLDPG